MPDSDWRNNETGATGLPQTHTTGGSSIATFFGSIGALNAGSTIAGNLAITSGTATSIELRVRCIETGVPVVNLLSKTLTHTSGASTVYSYLFTITNTTNCTAFDLAVLAASGSFTVGTATSVIITPAEVAPQPTALPVATTQPTAGPTPYVPPSTSTLDPYCLTGGKVEPYSDANGPGWRCLWSAKASDDGTGSAGNVRGALCGWIGANCELGGADHGNGYFIPTHPGQIIEFGSSFRLRPAEDDPVAVHVGNWLDCDTDGATGVIAVGLRFVAANGQTSGAADWPTDVTCASGHVSSSSGYVAVPDDAVKIDVWLVCLQGAVCVDDGTDGANGWYTLAMNVYTTSVEEPIDLGPCEDPTSESCLAPSTPIDPTTGLPVCGPLSGVCGVKPFFSRAVLALCPAPTNGLDAVGWMAMVACMVGNLPAVLYNELLIPAINAIIDLLFPGRLDEAWDGMRSAFETRAMFAWVGPVAQGWEDAWATVGTAPTTLATVQFAGQDIALGDALDDAMAELAPFRSVFLAIVSLAMLAQLRRKLIATLNSGASGEGAAA